MANGFVGVDILGAKELHAKFARLPSAIRDAVAEEVADYVVKIFQEYPPPRHVSRRRAYGRTFQSARQQRWFFAALASGAIRVPYSRTQELRRSWKKVGSGSDVIVASESEAAIWTMDDDMQARQPALVGWKTVTMRLRERSGQIRRRAEIGAKKGMRRAGL